MADIHGWIWVLVGILVIGISLYIGNLRVFILAGALFIIWGVFKLVRDYILPEEKPILKPWERDEVIGQGLNSGRESLKPTPKFYGQRQEQGNAHPAAIPCPTCRTQVWSHAHFCHFCGMRLKNP